VIVYAIFDRHEANIRTALEIYFILKWSEVKWVTVKFLGTKVPCPLEWTYTEGTWLYCDYLIWCVPGTVVIFTCVVMCGSVCMCGFCNAWMCLCVGVFMCGFCNVWVCLCVGFIMCGCVYVLVLLCVGVFMCGVFNVWVCLCVGVFICGFCNVWVCLCVGFVLSGCFGNMYICIYCVL
jgi:hypothetical protein